MGCDISGSVRAEVPGMRCGLSNLALQQQSNTRNFAEQAVALARMLGRSLSGFEATAMLPKLVGR